MQTFSADDFAVASPEKSLTFSPDDFKEAPLPPWAQRLEPKVNPQAPAPPPETIQNEIREPSFLTKVSGEAQHLEHEFLPGTREKESNPFDVVSMPLMLAGTAVAPEVTLPPKLGLLLGSYFTARTVADQAAVKQQFEDELGSGQYSQAIKTAANNALNLGIIGAGGMAMRGETPEAPIKPSGSPVAPSQEPDRGPVMGKELKTPVGAVPEKIEAQPLSQGIPAIPIAEKDIENALRAGRPPKAAVPGTASEAQSRNVIQEIRQRQLDTREKIRAAFPSSTKQQAAQLWRQAWPEKVQANKPKAGIPVTTTAISPEKELSALEAALGKGSLSPQQQERLTQLLYQTGHAIPSEDLSVEHPKATTATILPTAEELQSAMRGNQLKPKTQSPTGNTPESLKTLGKDDGFTYDGEMTVGTSKLHQFTFRNLPKDDPALEAKFYAKPSDTPEQILAKARAKAKEFRDAAKPTEPVATTKIAKQGEPTVSMTGPGSPQLGQGPDEGIGGGNPDVTGVRQETREKMAASGIPSETQRTPGVTLEQTLQEGRNLLAQNPNAAEQAVQAWDQSGRSSYEDFAALRAKIDQLRAAGRKLESSLGTDSPEFQKYLDNIYRLDKAAKDIQGKLWHRLGIAQQGELDVDTGTVLGLESDYMEKTKGRKFTPAQRKQATAKAKVSERINQESQKAMEEAEKEVETVAKGSGTLTQEQARSELAKLPKTQGDFSPEQTRIIWGRVRAIIKNGVVKPDDIIGQVANELGLKMSEVRRALSKNQVVRKRLNDAYLKQYRARQVKNAAKRWVEAQSVPPLLRNVIAVPHVLRALAVFGHWSTWIGTHAGQVLYDPTRWDAVGQAWKTMVMAGRPGEGGEILWEKEAADLVRDKYWGEARRAGLNNDPYQRQGSEYYDTPLIEGMKSKFSTGGRGVIGLLKLRQIFFNEMWDKLPPSGRTDDAAKYIAELANTTTGTTRSQWGQGNIGKAVLFAPRLVAARLKWEFTEPAKAALIKTFKQGTATPEEQMYANEILKRRGIFLATMFAALGANQAILSATDQKQKINWSNPHRSDWLAFKGFGMEARPFSAGMLILRTVVSIYDDIFRTTRTGRHLPVEPFKSAVGDAGQFFREELNPAASDVTTLATQEDAFGIPLPNEKWRSELGNPPPKLTRAQMMRGEKPYTWAQIAGEQLSPIPFEASIREAFQSQGMRPDLAAHWVRIIVGSAVMAATGVRVQEDTNQK